MFSYQITPISASTTHLADATGVASFLVQGKTKALLIDTGTGLGRLDEAVAGITALPLSVVLTHAHGDHAGGASLFDTVYLNEQDNTLLRHHNTLAMRMGYAQAMLPDCELTPADFAPDVSKATLPLTDGQIFDLGGITVEAIAVPGHTKGSMCMLIREERAILFGDACNPNTLLIGENACTVADYLQSLRRFSARSGAYDTVYYSHGITVGPRACLDDNIELCERILAGTDDKEPFLFLGNAALRGAAADKTFRRLDGKYGNIVYDATSLQR